MFETTLILPTIFRICHKIQAVYGTMAEMSGITVTFIYNSVSFALERESLQRNDPEVSIRLINLFNP